ncbi:MAG: hypothetical protein ACOY4N_00575 [Pseudomonadota bacterium]|uniref:hypothetical protein n=1 Tax=Sphingobium TaxID=165695 RepID=UPI001124981D|nr:MULTISPECIES: hypothetical protein [Sphingobium]QWT14140.1 hypothetical protein GTV57_16200 [Sphingobium xenophagum]
MESRDEKFEAWADKRRAEYRKAQPATQVNPVRPNIISRFFHGVGNIIGAAFGMVWIASIGIGILIAILSPGSCSSVNYPTEFRAR